MAEKKKQTVTGLDPKRDDDFGVWLSKKYAKDKPKTAAKKPTTKKK